MAAAYQSPPLAGRVVVVTGTSRGVGVGIAARLVEAGARVVGCSRVAPRGPTPPEDAYLHVIHDLASEPPEALLSAALERFGAVDGLVANAAIEHYGDCWAQSDEELDEMLAINLTAPFLLAQAFARHWVEHGTAGVVVNIGSVECKVGWPEPGQAGYAITKGGLLGLTRSLALDLARY
ncbi:MAG: SDR family oxidoreductase, partial [Actinobacteria bacterium]|nr:SDR family oxidoreductase [Actinomycetota bacterium]